MKSRVRKSICIFISAVLVVSGIPYRVSAEEKGITVSTSNEFMAALDQKKSPIIVSGLITIGDAADTSGRMLPVEIPAGTEICGENAEAYLNSRAPIQLEGDVSFHNVRLTFESTDALGSVPHREIFLAGHGLTFDNVKTWLEGGNNEFGSLGGTEEELLPTVYAGGFTNTNIGGNASLTVKNSNSETMFQAVYMSHDEGNDDKVPYYGGAELNLDSKLTVREKVDVSKNSEANICISGGENDTAKIKEFAGNENTVLTLSGCSLASAVLDNVGNIILTDKACLSPLSSTFNNITLRRGGCLDLNGVSDAMNVIISGNFAGVSDPAEERGILVVNQRSCLMIEGGVTGTTQFQTYHRLFPGTLLLDWPYISVNRENASRSNFVLAQKSIDNYGYQMEYSNGLWTVVNPEQHGAEETFAPVKTPVPTEVPLPTGETVVKPSALPTEVPLPTGETVVKPSALPTEVPLPTGETEVTPSALPTEVPLPTGETEITPSALPTEVPLPTGETEVTPSALPTEVPLPTGETEITPSPLPTEVPLPTGETEITPSPLPTGGTTTGPEGIVLPTGKPDEKVSPGPGQSQQPDREADDITYPPKKLMLSADTMAYTGKARKPMVTVKDTLGRVIGSQNYQVSYRNNIKPGQATVTVSFCGAYQGTMTKTFRIVPKGTEITGLSSVYGGFLVRWKKQPTQTSGYELQYSTGKGFVKRGTEKIIIKGNKTVFRSITGRKPGEKYFVRIRTYKTVKVNGKTKRFCSAWSKVRMVRSVRLR